MVFTSEFMAIFLPFGVSTCCSVTFIVSKITMCLKRQPLRIHSVLHAASGRRCGEPKRRIETRGETERERERKKRRRIRHTVFGCLLMKQFSLHGRNIKWFRMTTGIDDIKYKIYTAICSALQLKAMISVSPTKNMTIRHTLCSRTQSRTRFAVRCSMPTERPSQRIRNGVAQCAFRLSPSSIIPSSPFNYSPKLVVFVVSTTEHVSEVNTLIVK